MCHKTCPGPSPDCINCYFIDLKKAVELKGVGNT